MKTIIIHRKSSQRFLDQYRVLFQPFLESGKVEFCFWDENAKDFASSLPNLPSKIRGETEWRAIVALPVEAADGEDEQLPAEEEYLGDNPFDFEKNSAQEPFVEESRIPLIRLAQMLGGIPLVTPRVQTEFAEITDEIDGKQKVLRATTESGEQLAEKQKLWQEMTDHYSTSCVLPSQLYLFKGRVLPDIGIPNIEDVELISRHESDSSMFWYRNAYPAKARFLTKTFSRPGHARYHTDLFEFWMTVLTLAINDVPTGTFEAYKLYDTRAVISREMVQKTLSQYYHRLDRIRYSARMKIIEYQKNAQFEREQDTLPFYTATVPVKYRHIDDSDLKISADGLGLANDCPKEELPWWMECAHRSRKALDKVISSIHPVLDRACLICKSMSLISDEELVGMDEYQFEEMEDELAALEVEILTFNKNRVLPLGLFHRRIDQRKAETATRMRKHISRNRAIIAGCTALGIYLLCFLPDLIRQAVSDSVYYPIISALVGTIILGVTGLGALLWYRRSVRIKIGNYNGTMQDILDMIRDSAAKFSHYLSKCCSYMRGRSLLQTLTKRAMISISGIRMMSDHADQLKDYMEMIKTWLGQFNLPMNEPDTYEGDLVFDFEIPPSRNREYQLRNTGYSLKIPTVDGSQCTAPYPFVTAFQVVRVPLYEAKQPEPEEPEQYDELEFLTEPVEFSHTLDTPAEAPIAPEDTIANVAPASAEQEISEGEEVP